MNPANTLIWAPVSLDSPDVGQLVTAAIGNENHDQAGLKSASPDPATSCQRDQNTGECVPRHILLP